MPPKGKHLPFSSDPQPPAPYGDLTELEQIFARAMPGMRFEMAALLGKRTPRLTRKESAETQRKLHRFLHTARPYLLGLYALNEPADRDRCTYALLEGLFREHLRAGGKKVPQNRDAFDFLRELAGVHAASPKAAWATAPPYSLGKGKLYEFCDFLQVSVNPLLVERLLENWARSKDARKAVQFAIAWQTLIRQFRLVSPKRLTMKLATQLSNEYRTSASFVEQRIRLLVFLDQTAKGNMKQWEDWEKTTLFQLVESAAASLTLNWIPPFIDRHVRNALAHGQPEINLDLDECRFHDQKATVVWKFDEFFANTKRLTLTARVLLEFEAIRSHVQAQGLVEALWKPFASG